MSASSHKIGTWVITSIGDMFPAITHNLHSTLGEKTISYNFHLTKKLIPGNNFAYQANFWLCKINQSRWLYLARIWKVENYLSQPHPKKKTRLSYPLHPFYVLCKISLSSAQIPTISLTFNSCINLSYLKRSHQASTFNLVLWSYKNKVIKFIYMLYKRLIQFSHIWTELLSTEVLQKKHMQLCMILNKKNRLYQGDN